MRQTQGFHQTNVERINGELEHSGRELAEILQALEENAAEAERKKQNIEKIERTIAASYDTQNESEGRLKETVARKEELTAKQKTFFQRREEMAEKLSALDKEVFRLQEQKEKAGKFSGKPR